MSTAFVALIRAGQVPAAPLADLPDVIGVHALRELIACPEPDDAFAVVLDPPLSAPGQSAQVAVVLQTLQAVGMEEPEGGLVVTSVRPVTDTLKGVGPGGALAGTADRDRHRFVTVRMAARLGVLRQALAHEPQAKSAAEILAALTAAGATVVASAS